MTETLSIRAYTGLDALARSGCRRYALALGVFDTLHAGHQCVFRMLRDLAEKTHATPVVMTFYPHPRQVVFQTPVSTVLSTEQKLFLLERYGIHAMIVSAFTPEFSHMEPSIFLQTLLQNETLHLTALVVGAHWRFGYKGAGDTAFLSQWARREKILFQPVPELVYQQDVISSTRVRQALQRGDLAELEHLLKRRYSLYGRVVHGRGIAAAQLGVPTANIDFQSDALLPYGVYLAMACADKQQHPALAILSTAPTFDTMEQKPRLEVHILNAEGDWYDHMIDVQFLRFMHPQIKFDSIAALREKVHHYVDQARDAFAHMPSLR